MGTANRIVLLEDDKNIQRFLIQYVASIEQLSGKITLFDTVSAALTDLAERVHDGLHLSTVFLVDGKLLDGYSQRYLRELAAVGVPRQRVIYFTGSDPADDYLQYCGAALLKPATRKETVAAILLAAS